MAKNEWEVSVVESAWDVVSSDPFDGRRDATSDPRSALFKPAGPDLSVTPTGSTPVSALPTFSADPTRQDVGVIDWLAAEPTAPKKPPEAPYTSKVAKALGVPEQIVSEAVAKAEATVLGWAKDKPASAEAVKANFQSLAQSYVDDAALRYKLDNRDLASTVKNLSVADLPRALWAGLLDTSKGAMERIGNKYDAELMGKARDELREDYSPGLKNELSLSAEALKTTGESLGGMAPAMLAGGVVGEGASALLGATKLGRAAITAGEITNAAGTKAPLAARALNLAPAIAGSAVGEAAVSAAQGASQAADEFDQLLRADPGKILASPAYAKMLEQHDNPATALTALREDAIAKSSNYQGIATFLTGLIPNTDSRLVGRALGRTAGSPVGPVAVARRIASEPLQEFVQSGAEAVASNAAKQQTFDPTKALGDDALMQASMGAIAGGLTSGAIEGVPAVLSRSTGAFELGQRAGNERAAAEQFKAAAMDNLTSATSVDEAVAAATAVVTAPAATPTERTLRDAIAGRMQVGPTEEQLNASLSAAVPGLDTGTVGQGVLDAAGGVGVGGGILQPNTGVAAGLDAGGTPSTPGQLGAATNTVADKVWTGRSGDGYATPEAAAQGLKLRQSIQPEYQWASVQRTDGKWQLEGRLRGTQTQETVPPETGQPSTALPDVGAGERAAAIRADVEARLQAHDAAFRASLPQLTQQLSATTDPEQRRQLSERIESAKEYMANRPIMGTPAPELETAVLTMGKALGAQLGTDPNAVVAFSDTRPNAVYGIEVAGRAMINVGDSLPPGIVNSTGHEFKHVLERIAAAEAKLGKTGTPTQRLVSDIHSLFDGFTDVGKRNYATNYLYKEELAAIRDPKAREARLSEILVSDKLKSEMSADFFGKRMTDKPFIDSMAKADPIGFKAFAQKWLAIIDNVLAKLRGVKGATHTETAKIDSYAKNLNQSKLLLRNALVKYSTATRTTLNVGLSTAEVAGGGSIGVAEVRAELAKLGIDPLDITVQQSDTEPTAVVTIARPLTQAEGDALSVALKQEAIAMRRADGTGELYGPKASEWGPYNKDFFRMADGKAPPFSKTQAVHYGKVGGLTTLSGTSSGTGIKGEERARLDQPGVDPRIKKRVYFYIGREGEAIPNPEAGLGQHVYRAALDNIADSDKPEDMARIRAAKKGTDANAFEAAVLDAGFDGYMNREQGTIVALGRDVPVSYDGTIEGKKQFTRAPVVHNKPAVGRREGEYMVKKLTNDEMLAFSRQRAAITEKAPSVKMQFGELRVKADEAGALAGVVQFSKAQDEYAAVEKQYKGTDQWMKAPNGKKTKLSERQWVQVRTPSFVRWFGPWEKFANVWDDDGEVSKVVDENGEPLVIYHGTDKGGFMAFDRPRGVGRGDLGIFASDNYSMARSYVRKGRSQDIEARDDRAEMENIGIEFREADGQAFYTDDYGQEYGPFDTMQAAVEDAASDREPASTQTPGIYASFMNLRNPVEADFEGALWNGSRDHQWVVEVGGEIQSDYSGKQYFDTVEEAAEFASTFTETGDDPLDYVLGADEHYQTTDDVVREARAGKNDGAIIRDVIDDGGGPGYDDRPSTVFVAFDPNQLKSAVWNTGEFGETDDMRYSKAQTDTPAFKQWFGDSKVVDANGKPLVVYHGTAKDFSVFAAQSHFGSARAANDRIVDRGEAHASLIMPVYLAIDSPLRVTDAEASDEATFLNAVKRRKYPGVDLNTALRKGSVRAAEEAGYDGFVYKNRLEDKGRDSWVAFHPEQIKSAIGNTGVFDSTNPDMRYSKAQLSDFTPERLPQLLDKTDWAVLTAEDPGAKKATKTANLIAMRNLRKDLAGYDYLPVIGKYGDVQNSYIVTGIPEAKAMELGAKYGQESILTRKGLQYMDGRPDTVGTGVSVFETAPDDFYTEIPKTGAFFSVDLNFSKAQTETPEFKRWFGDSKVVDADGKPLVVYHGSATDISSFGRVNGFSTPTIPPGGVAGFFFAGRPDHAEHYATQAGVWQRVLERSRKPSTGGGATIYPVFLSLKNPMRVRLEKWRHAEQTRYGAMAIRTKAEKSGFDGLFIEDDDGTVFEYVAFHPEQIKSAIGNTGVFDSTNPDMRYSKAQLSDFTPERLPQLLDKTDWAVLTAEDPGAKKATKTANLMAMRNLRKDLTGYDYLPVIGKYGDVQNSYIVTGIPEAKALELGKKYGQESILTRKGLQYMDGRPDTVGTGVSVFDTAPDDFYTEVPKTGAFFSVDLAFSKAQTDTPEFKRWFGDSKVVDANGKPLVVYHGTSSDFSTFSTASQGESFGEYDGAFPREGFWFTDSPSNADWYSHVAANGLNGEKSMGARNTMPVYLSLKNPYRYSAQMFADEGEAGIPEQGELEAKGYDGMIVEVASDEEAPNQAAEAMWEKYTPQYGAPVNWPKALREKYSDLLDVPPVLARTHYVAFRPEQIKSALGNNGNFDPKNPDIRYSKLQDRVDNDYDTLLSEYNALNGTKGGKLLDADIARELSPEYRADRTRAAEVHEAVSSFVDKAYTKRIQSAEPGGLVVFMAGGGGAGKSSADAFIGAAMDEAHLVVDGTLSSPEKARRWVAEALSNGQAVRIVYVYREPLDAFKNGVLPRAMSRGRVVPIPAVVKGHAGSSQTVRQLASEFGGNELFNVIAIDNSRGAGNATIVALHELPEVAKHNLEESLHEAAKTAYAEGRISDEVYRATSESQGRQVRSGGEKPVQERRGPVEAENPVRLSKAQPYKVFGQEIAPLAIKAYKSLSPQAQSLVVGWNVNWSVGQGRIKDTEQFEEVKAAYAPVRDKLRQLFGDAVPAYRGESSGPPSNGDRFLFSWTPIKDLAVAFAINRRRGLPAQITQEQVDAQIANYQRTGIARLNGYKFVKRDPGSYVPDGPDYYHIYWRGEMQTDGDNIAKALQAEKTERDDYLAQLRAKGDVYVADVPVDSIAFVPVNANLREPEFVAEYNPRTQGAEKVSFSKSQGFYSALDRGIENLTANSAPARGWIDAIKGLVNKGVAKADEVEWSGVNDWLNLQQGGKVTKAQVREYLKGNGVRVEETVLGAGLPLFSRQQGFDIPDETRARRVQRQLQDYFRRVLTVQEAISGQGGVVTEQSDVYQAEESSRDRIANQMKDFAELAVKPLVKKAAKNKIDLDELALYAYARYAPDRNAKIAKINKRFPDGGSGMTDQEAQDILDAFEKEGKTAALDELHADLMGMTAATRAVQLDDGLISQAQYDAWSAEPNYIPLRGFERVNEDDEPVRGLPRGRGMDVRGKESMRALGRASRAGDLIENVLLDYSRAIERGDHNKVGRAFLQLVLDNPDPSLWEIDLVRARQSMDSTGRVKISRGVEKGEQTFGVKVGGADVYISVYDPLLLRALRNLSSNEISGFERVLVKTVGTYTNLLRNTLTRYNPTFAATNAVKDIGFANTYVLGKLGAKGVAQFNTNLAGALGAAWRDETGQIDPQKRAWDKVEAEYHAAGGGSSGGFYGHDADAVAKEMRTLMMLAGAAPKTAMEKLQFGALKHPAKAARGLLRGLEMVGATSENMTRLAVYKTARDMGWSVSKAASLAKNATTNFTRKGEWGTSANAAYMFFNAAVQGTAALGEAMKSRNVQGAMAGVTAFSVAVAMLGASFGGDDEDDGQSYWDKIPDHEKDRHLIIMLPPGAELEGAERVGQKGRYIKVPVQYGLNFFTTLGYSIADVLRNQADSKTGKSAAKAGVRLASSLMATVNPFGGSVDVNDPTTIALAVSPTVADTGIQLWQGVNAFGRRVVPEQSPYDTRPDSENATLGQYGSAAHRVARWMNTVTGGNQGKSGAIDIAPGTVENVVTTLTGGTGRFLMDVFVNLPTKLASADADVTARDVPFWRNFYSEVDANVDASIFYDRRKEILNTFDTIERQIKLGIDPKPTDREKALYGMSEAAKEATGILTDLKKAEIAIIDSDASKTEKDVRIKELKSTRNKLFRLYDKAFFGATSIP